MNSEVQAAIDLLVARYNEYRKDGMTWSEMAKLVGAAMGQVVQIVEKVAGGGIDKKALGMTLIEMVVDKVITPIDLPGPDVILDPILKRFLMASADMAIETAVAIYNSTHWPDEIVEVKPTL